MKVNVNTASSKVSVLYYTVCKSHSFFLIATAKQFKCFMGCVGLTFFLSIFNGIKKDKQAYCLVYSLAKQVIKPCISNSVFAIKYNSFYLILGVNCQDLPETWSYPESTANGWDGVCTTGTKQSPIELYHSELPAPSIHSNIKFKNYFSANSRNTFGYFKVEM